MNLRLMKIHDALANSFWFLPALMALVAGGMALGSVTLDHALGSGWVRDIGWVWSGGADGARSVLSTVAGSIVTVISIVFSLTITTLAQTSSHFGPRVLRNFTSDRGVQFTLGTFIATFVYCLLVLRTVRSIEESTFVPYISVNLGVALAIASLAVLIYFIHHISQSIQAENLIGNIGNEYQKALPVLFPQRVGQPLDENIQHIPDRLEWEKAHVIDSVENGYVQRIDETQIMRLAVQHNLLLRIERRPGDFVSLASPLLRVLQPSQVTRSIEGELRACFSLGKTRTPYQDSRYPMQQLVEIAAHALSPGINEPFTALTCIDWLGASLRGIVRSDIPSPYRRDDSGELRVLAFPPNFSELARTAFDQVRLYGSSNPDIVMRLLEVIGELASYVRRPEDRQTLIRHAQLIGSDANQIVNEADRERVATQLRETLRALAFEPEAQTQGV